MFTVEPDSNSSLYVSWNEVSLKGTVPELLRYDIQYLSVSTGQSGGSTELFGTRSILLTGLESNIDYRVTISASFLTGRGPSTSKAVSTFANGIYEIRDRGRCDERGRGI